jgi:hypothetical protein
MRKHPFRFIAASHLRNGIFSEIALTIKNASPRPSPSPLSLHTVQGRNHAHPKFPTANEH